MNRREMERDMKDSIGAYPNISQLAKYMGWGRDRTRRFVQGLPRIGNRMFYKDIVERMKENEQWTITKEM